MSEIRSLTALRFLGALAILLSHVRFTIPALAEAAQFDKLFFGVELFFELSGFVLALRYRAGVGDQGLFLVRRLVRILPLHLVTALTWMALFGVPAAGALAVISNLTLTQAFMPGYDFSMSLNPVSWSLSAELFFYLVFPFVLRPMRAVAAMILIGGFTLAWTLAGIDAEGVFPALFFFMPPLRLFEFCCGILAGHLFLSVRERRCGPGTATSLELLSVVLLAVAVQATGLLPDQFGQIAAAPAFALLIGVLAREEGLISRALAGNSWLVALGGASFSLYIWHHMAFTLVGRFDITAALPWTMLGLATAALCLGSLASHRLIEEPLRALMLRVFESTRSAAAAP